MFFEKSCFSTGLGRSARGWKRLEPNPFFGATFFWRYLVCGMPSSEGFAAPVLVQWGKGCPMTLGQSLNYDLVRCEI
jgi:hypothetical protein